MLRRCLAVATAVCLLGGAAAAPAGAKKKPKRQPVTFTASGTVSLGHPGDFFGGANVTRTAFLQACAVPPSQGTDGYVIELPAEVTAVPTNVTISGADALGAHDLDIFFFDDGCAPTGELNTTESNEFGLMPAGTSYVLVTAFVGVEIAFDFKATGV